MIRRIQLMLAAVLVLPLVAVTATGSAGAEVDGVSPERVLDTRVGIGVRRGAVDPGAVIRLKLDGVDTSGDTTVLLNLTGTGASQRGFVSAWSCADPEPDTSILNFEPWRAVPNAVALRYTSKGLCFSSSATVHLVADLTGVATDGHLSPSTPNRIVDTRESKRLSGGREYRYRVAGRPGIPNKAVAAMLNVTVHLPSAEGYLLVGPCDTESSASTMNFRAGEVVAHFAFAALTDGDVCVTSSVATGLIIDTFGSVPSASDLEVVTPARLLDTRRGIGTPAGALHDGDVVRFRVAGYGGIPNDAAGATVNAVAVKGAAIGYLSMWPCNGGSTDTSLLNLWPGVLRANQGTFEIAADGDICLGVSIEGSSGIHVVVDAVGYVDGNVDRDPAPPTTLPPTTTPPPSSGRRFTTLPVGAALPSGAECASRVRSAPEIRPDNAAANANAGNRSNANGRDDWAGFDRVDGAFAGTTDEIIQWAACKWGLDEDMARAQVVKESWWLQSTNGDGGDSWGLGQVRDTAHQSAFEYSSVNARNSSAYNLDYTFASWRACFEGVYTWLGGSYGPGDAWGCMGVWFSGRWYNQPAIDYLEGGDPNDYGSRGVKQHYTLRTWEDPVFVNG